MFKYIFLTIFLFSMDSFSQINLMTDQDGNEYKTIKIGNKVWMAENLKVTHYRNGDSIPNIKEYSDWASTRKGAYCVYNNNEKYGNRYGYLYNWFAISDCRKIAPKGWHVPSDDEWKELESSLGINQSTKNTTKNLNSSHSIKLLGNDTLWYAPLGKYKNFNTSGFNAVPAGMRMFAVDSNSQAFGTLGNFENGKYFKY